jgi:DNA-binding IscR family transcriptional regulator
MAVHVLTVLAYKRNENVSSALLAASVNTNPVIIRRLLLALQQAKLVQTRRGAGLGSRLGRAAGRINLAEVFRAVEGEPAFVLPRRKPSGTCPVGCGIGAAMGEVFASAHHALERELARRTLADVLRAATSATGLPLGATKSGPEQFGL